MEIRNTGMAQTYLDPYGAAAGTEKSAETRNRPRASDRDGESSGGDTVSVSRDALLLTEARRMAQSAPDVRTDRVEALRAQVADGTYIIDARRIAASLVREEPGLFQV